ncbi:hypothetical protein EUTSA_v10005383mg [Eutrema salsugineum]|uniref:Uncharacterized protein n=1 Tax=Eutrema salsugineum TaxID=72664 RepID=V4KX02_EUTSA|nr:transcription factor SRM1 [Eutrema salsugineum]ESQ31913.1 hypothetical protein EUTSA_v10005383mg [Eutrema salsugineum]
MTVGEKISGGSSWSRDDDIAFERALATYTDETDKNRWDKIAAVVPGKTVEQIVEHYDILLDDVKMIESGCVPLPDYDFSEETNDKETSNLECGNNRKCEYKQEEEPKLMQNRRKGIAWTSNEHRQFLLGLEKYGKGDWRSISRDFVVTRTPTQVGSHAQKYFARLNSKNKHKQRPSIYDVSVTYGTPTIWNTPPSTSQPSLGLPVYGTVPTMWNTQAASQPLVHIPPTYGTPTIGPSMVGVRPVVLPFGMVGPHMAYGVHHHPVPPNSTVSTVHSEPMNINP